VDAEIASAEAHLLAGRPEQALVLIERALPEAAPSTPPLCCRRRTAVQAAALFAWVRSQKLGRLWPRACGKAPHLMLRTSGASCLQSRAQGSPP
jgi:hypothetical protein